MVETSSEELKTWWKERAQSQFWQQLFHSLGLEAEISKEGLEEATRRTGDHFVKVKRELAQDSATATPSKSKRAKTANLESQALATPPKEKGPKRVQGSQPASFGQAADSDGRLMKPCMKRKARKKAEQDDPELEKELRVKDADMSLQILDGLDADLDPEAQSILTFCSNSNEMQACIRRYCIYYVHLHLFTCIFIDIYGDIWYMCIYI